MKNRILSLLLACILLFTLCPLSALADEGDGGSSGTPAETVAVTKVTVVPNTLNLEVGDSNTLSAAVEPSTATDKTVTWTSSNPSVAAVDDTGRVTAMAEGTATVTAVSNADGSISDACTVTVTTATGDLTTVNVSTDNATLSIGDKTTVITSTMPTDAEITDYTWSIADTSVATISGNGMSATVTAVSPGETNASVTVTDKHGNTVTGSCTITVSGITISETELTLMVGRSSTLTVYRYGAATNFDSAEWETSHTSVASVASNGKITARSQGTTTITVTMGTYSATCEVTVEENRAATITATLSGGILSLDEVVSEVEQRCQSVTGEPLDYLSSLQVPTKQGTLYNNYVSPSDTGSGVASGQKYYLGGDNAYQLSNVTFVPKDTFSGTAEITYNGYTSTGQSYSGTIEVTVEETTGINYNSDNSSEIHFQASDFAAYCQSVNQRPLKYVTFNLPAAKYGTLYYNYTGNSTDTLVTEDTKYYRTSNPNLDNVTFVPNPDYSGTFSLSFDGCDTSNYPFSGRVKITVSKGSSNSSDGYLTYSGRPGKHIYFNVDDFSQASYDETGYQLDYVRFTLPSSSKGTLYYNSNTKVSASTSYYRTGSDNLLKNVNFVPDDNFTGTVRISFRGYNTRDKSFSGTIEIDVSEDNNSSNSGLTYRVKSGERVYFDPDDFSDESYDQTGYQLDYVRFSPPSSSKGTLYYNGSTEVTSGTSYYRSGSGRLLEDVSFVADKDFTGTVNISFTGYNTKGKSFTGTVKVIVSDSGSSSTISYSGKAGQAINFRASDFSNASYDATDSQLDYVRFSIPSASKGVLYYDGDTKVTANTSYYYNGSGKLLSKISFVPDSSASGTITLSYTGYNNRGKSFDGTVEISVTRVQAIPVVYSTTGQPVTFQAADFVRACASTLPGTLSYVRFYTPDASVGTLYGQYTSPIQNTPFNAAQNYSISGSPSLSQVTFLPKAGVKTALLVYTAADTDGNTVDQTVTVTVTTPTSSAYFKDMNNAAWAIPAVDFLHGVGVVNGTTSTTYGPSQPLTRGAFLVMLSRAFPFQDAGTYSFRDVPQDSYYARAIASAKSMGIISGESNGNFYPNQTVTRQAAAAILYRCLERTGSITPGSASNLSRFTDANQVSSYAISAMGALVRDGIFTGNADNQLSPRGTLTRAQMAVILYRALT